MISPTADSYCISISTAGGGIGTSPSSGMYAQGSGNLGTLSPLCLALCFPFVTTLYATLFATVSATVFSTVFSIVSPRLSPSLSPTMVLRCCLPLASHFCSFVLQLSSTCRPDVVSHFSPSCLRLFYRCGLPIVSQCSPSLFQICSPNCLLLVSNNFQLSPRWVTATIPQSTCLPVTSQM